MFKIYRVIRHRIGIDGEGVTSLVALSGCSLSCKYCLNARILKRGIVYEVSPEALLGDVLRDACYMIATGGGVCFGGGEPLLQYEAIAEFAKIKPDWMYITIETSLQATKEAVLSLLPYVDFWIVDIKTLDAELYRDYTGGNIDTMLDNLDILSEFALDKCQVRIPIIPNFKDKETALLEEKEIRKKGFTDIDVFEYIVRA